MVEKNNIDVLFEKVLPLKMTLGTANIVPSVTTNGRENPWYNRSLVRDGISVEIISVAPESR
jgi:hypothetical protein